MPARTAPPRTPEHRMSVAAHLREARRRMIAVAAAVVVGTAIGWVCSDAVWAALGGPLTAVAATDGRPAAINYSGITSAFDVKLQLSIGLGIIVTSPFWLYQVFAFVVPGLRRGERRYVAGFLGAAVPLFSLGCVVGWWVFPHIMEVMVGFAPQNSASLINARDYLEFATKLVVATGIAFVLPVVLVVVNRMGLVTARGILKGWRVAILLITVFTALATPAADVMSMFLLAAPMVGLYFAAVGVCAINDARQNRRLAAYERVGVE